MARPLTALLPLPPSICLVASLLFFFFSFPSSSPSTSPSSPSQVCADGLFVRGEGGEVHMDESTLTGESEPVRKGNDAPFLLSGTTVSEGAGVMLVTAVGSRCEWGRVIALTTGSEAEPTPLQAKLEVLANDIGKARARPPPLFSSCKWRASCESRQALCPLLPPPKGT